MTDESMSALLGALLAEEEGAQGYEQTELITAQTEALRRYFGDPYGDEIPGRSAVRSQELREVVEWLRPDLLRIFVGGKHVCDCDPVIPGDERHSEVAAALLNKAIMEDNPGFRLIDGFLFDGLLQRIGVLSCYWREAKHQAPITIEGVSILQAQEYLQREAQGQLRIEGHTKERSDDLARYPDGYKYAIKIRKLDNEGCVEVIPVAPEDFRVSGRATDLDSARYVGAARRMMRGDAVRRWPEHAGKLQSTMYESPFDTYGSAIRQERFRDQTDMGFGHEDSTGNSAGADIVVLEEYIRFDLDGDDYPELIRSYRVGPHILEAEEVEEHPFGWWTPIPIPHRLHGISMYDLMQDLQKVKTVTMRAMVDGMLLATTPRMIANQNLVNLDDLLNVQVGAVIRVQGDVGAAVQPLIAPDVSGAAYQLAEYVDQTLERRTGISRHAQGLNPDSLNKTATGIDLLQQAASARKEAIARNAAFGLERFYAKIYRLLVRRKDSVSRLRVAGSWVDVDPTTLPQEMRVRVSTGLGTGSRQAQMAMAMQIIGMQQQWVQAYGPQTPIVTPNHLYAAMEEALKAMGYSSADPFFGRPQEGYAPEPPPNPAAQKAQMEMQAKQADMQMRQQEQQASAAGEAQKLALERERIQQQMALEREKFMAEMELKRAQFEAELQMQREQMAAEARLKQEAMYLGSDGGKERIGSDVRFGGEVG